MIDPNAYPHTPEEIMELWAESVGLCWLPRPMTLDDKFSTIWLVYSHRRGFKDFIDSLILRFFAWDFGVALRTSWSASAFQADE